MWYLIVHNWHWHWHWHGHWHWHMRMSVCRYKPDRLCCVFSSPNEPSFWLALPSPSPVSAAASRETQSPDTLALFAGLVARHIGVHRNYQFKFKCKKKIVAKQRSNNTRVRISENTECSTRKQIPGAQMLKCTNANRAMHKCSMHKC